MKVHICMLCDADEGERKKEKWGEEDKREPPP
jgi:hypothetical protein